MGEEPGGRADLPLFHEATSLILTQGEVMDSRRGNREQEGQEQAAVFSRELGIGAVWVMGA